MAKKKTETEKVIEKIFDYTLEDIMGERFGSYSKYIIQDRAIPDARDGLKPVQRRILYSMYKEKNTYDRGYRKSAKTVGDVIGNYHPHGDTSIYDAMVRMSQSWKTRLPYIDMHGNNGSIDGDSPAAYRYTEARLSKISNEMLRDIDKNTVLFAPNFDDTTKEPTVLPARFPALLVYGAQGISAGYATNIPPHNLAEVIDATVHRIDNPNCRLETLMEYVKGPDFPTGGIVCGREGLNDAYKSGRGRVVIKSRYEFSGNHMIITEIPYEVNKALLVKKIDDIRIDKKIDGIVEVRDESTDDVRIVIDLKKDCNKELIEAYLLKNTNLQISYNFNVVSIVNRRPKLLGLKEALDAFIAHQKIVIRKRTEFDLNHAKARLHIVEGLIKCISILDEVIRVIRKSKNKGDAKDNLVKEFAFSEEQAEAIVTLRLYRLTNTDVVSLQEEMDMLKKIIDGLSRILNDEEILKKVMKDELRKVKHEYKTERLTEVRDEIEDIKIDKTSMINEEDVIVSITKDGYIKRSSLRSYSSTTDGMDIKEGDYLLGLVKMSTLNTLLLFTNLGNYLFLPVHTIPDMKYKDMGKHVSNVIPLSEGEEIISSIPVYDFNSDEEIVLVSSKGLVKRTKVKDFNITRYSRPTLCMKIDASDKLINAFIDNKPNIFLATDSGYGLAFKTKDIPVVGVKAKGVKGIKLKDDLVVSANNFSYEEDEFLTVITDRGTGKRIRLNEFDLSSRARRGLLIIREVKTNPYKVLKTFITDSRNHIILKNDSLEEIKITALSIADRYSTGKEISKNNLDDACVVVSLEEERVPVKKEDTVVKKKTIDLNEIDDKLMTIDDFLN